MVLANRTESQTNVLTCTTAGNGTVTDSATLTVGSAPQITIEPSPSLDGDYTVSWSAPVAPYDQTRLLEKVGSGAWGVVGTYLSTVTSKVFRNKPGGTYQYKTQQCLDVLNITRCSDLAGPKSVTVTGPTPATPATPTGPATSTGSHTVRWVAVTSATGYKLQERRNTESWTEYDEGTATSKALSGKKSGAWEYQVQACNGAVCSGWSGSLRILVSVAPPGTLTIEPSPSLDGDYTVSWSAPVAPYDQTRLLEKVGSGAWGVVGTYLSTVTSKVFRNKPGGTYQYKTQQCLDVLNITHCSDLAGPASVDCDGAADGKHQLESLDSGVRGHVDVALEFDGGDGLYAGRDRRGDERFPGTDQPDGDADERVVLHGDGRNDSDGQRHADGRVGAADNDCSLAESGRGLHGELECVGHPVLSDTLA